MPLRLRHCLVLCATLLCTACAASGAPEREPAPAAPSAAASDIQAELRKSVAALQPLLPLRVHEVGDLIAVRTYGMVLELTYQFTRDSQAPRTQQTVFSVKAAKAAIDAMGCGNPSIVALLAKGVVARYRFLDQDDRLFFAFDLKEENCGKTS